MYVIFMVTVFRYIEGDQYFLPPDNQIRDLEDLNEVSHTFRPCLSLHPKLSISPESAAVTDNWITLFGNIIAIIKPCCHGYCMVFNFICIMHVDIYSLLRGKGFQ